MERRAPRTPVGAQRRFSRGEARCVAARGTGGPRPECAMPPPPVSEANEARTEEIVVPGLEEDEEGTRVVREELKLLQTVYRALGPDPAAAGNSPSSPPAGPTLNQSLAADDARLVELRELASIAKPEDMPALLEQMHTLGALRA